MGEGERGSRQELRATPLAQTGGEQAEAGSANLAANPGSTRTPEPRTEPTHRVTAKEGRIDRRKAGVPIVASGQGSRAVTGSRWAEGKALAPSSGPGRSGDDCPPYPFLPPYPKASPSKAFPPLVGRSREELRRSRRRVMTRPWTLPTLRPVLATRWGERPGDPRVFLPSQRKVVPSRVTEPLPPGGRRGPGAVRSRPASGRTGTGPFAAGPCPDGRSSTPGQEDRSEATEAPRQAKHRLRCVPTGWGPARLGAIDRVGNHEIRFPARGRRWEPFHPSP